MKNLDLIDTINPSYLIDYQNGYMQPATAGTLDGAIAEATENFAYTQCDVIIKMMDGKPLAISRWYSTPYFEDDEPLEIIGYGWYDRFVDYETGEYI